MFVDGSGMMCNLCFTGSHNLPDNLFTQNDVHNLATCYFTVCFLSFSEGIKRNHVKVSSDHTIELVMTQWF